MASAEVILSFAAALVVGAALSVSGAVLQSVLRNPLAEPYILGIVGGSALFSALAAKCGVLALGAWTLSASSFLGSCFSLFLLALVAYFAARAREANGSDAQLRSSYSTVVVSGFVVGGFTGSLDWLVLSYCSSEDFTRLNKWLYGSLAHVSWSSLVFGAAAVAAVFAVLWRFRRELNVMELGHDEAECLGVDTRTVILAVVGSVALATSVSVSLAGAIGFVGLVVPHFVRRVFGPRMQRLLPLSAAFGGVFLAFAQLVCRLLPDGVGVGVVCAIFGAPFFLYLLASRRNGEGQDI
ncbi:MAG: iron ABC transporter permease [Kiritimatiellae bacterium]|nr:iron ABC transporter permease [Kiritimatiellia bacterium]